MINEEIFQSKESSEGDQNHCRSMSAYLVDRVLGDRQSRRRSRIFRSHLKTCPACRELDAQARRAWESLGGLQPGFCPDYIARRVMGRLAASPRSRPVRLRRLVLVASATGAAAAILVTLWPRPVPIVSPAVDHSASTVISSPRPLPDIDRTLDDYLEKAEAFLVNLQSEEDWKSTLPGLIESDLTGRGNYLKGRLEAGSAACRLVDRLHDTFLELLRAGREEAGQLPPVAGVELIDEIRRFRSRRND